jgi:hypothetical protein
LRERRKADPASAPVFRKLRRCMLVLEKGFGRREKSSGPYEKTFTHFCQLLRATRLIAGKSSWISTRNKQFAKAWRTPKSKEQKSPLSRARGLR